MAKWKRYFITPYLLGATAGLVGGLVGLALAEWAWASLTLITAPAVFVTVVHTLRPTRARTPRRYPSFVVLGALGWVGTWFGWPNPAAGVVGAVLLAGLLAYLYGYSEFHLPKSRFLTEGQTLPEFEAQGLDGKPQRSSDLRGSPSLILFYRGNWCPVCTAQIDELVRAYRELSARGIRVVLISPQPEDQTAALANRLGLPWEFWRDENNRAAQRLGIVDPAGLPLGMELLGYGSDTPVPTALLVGADGTILYSDQAENYRIRPEPRGYLEAFDLAQNSLVRNT